MSRENPPNIEIHWEVHPMPYSVTVGYPGDVPMEEITGLANHAEAQQAARNLQTLYRGAQIIEYVV